MIFSAKYLFLLPIIILALYFLLQTRNTKIKMFILGVISFSLIYLMAKIGGIFFYDSRPFVVDHFVPLINHVSDNGFPSDHMLLSSAIASIVYLYNKKISIFLWLLAFIVGFSRIYVGVHHFVDIIASAVLAVCITFVINKYISPILNKKIDRKILNK